MAVSINLGDDDSQDDGYVEITFEKVTVKLDVYEWNSRMHEYWKANKDKSAHEYNEGLCGIMVEAGFPKPSHYVAQRFQRAIDQLAADLLAKKKPSAASQGSTVFGPDEGTATAP